MTAPLVVERLTKTIKVGFLGRPRTVLEEVSFSVAEGATVGFVGGNGAGKSTTIRHIVGLARPSSGTARVFGRDPARPAHRRGLGFLPETTSFAQSLTPMMLLRQQASLCGIRLSDGEVLRRLDEVELSARAHDPVGSFSKGMRQRLGIAMAIIDDPMLLVLDEPMSGLDPAGREHMRRLIRAQSQRGCAVLFSSHVLADVEALCSDVVVINRGRIVHAGPTTTALGVEPRAWEIDCVPASGVDLKALLPTAQLRKTGDAIVVALEAKEDALAIAVRLRSEGVAILGVRAVAPTLEARLLELMR